MKARIFAIFFRRRRLKKRSEKTRIARSKRKHRKGKGRGQAAEKKRSPLHLVWKRGRARSAKVHACGAQINQEFQEISRECEGSPKNKRHASRSPRSSFRNFADNGQRTKKRAKCFLFFRRSGDPVWGWSGVHGMSISHPVVPHIFLRRSNCTAHFSLEIQ